MKRLALILLILFVMALAGGQDAKAQQLKDLVPVSDWPSLTRQPIIQTWKLESIEEVAKSYWSQRDVVLPNEVYLYYMNPESGIAARGEQPGNEVWLTLETYEQINTEQDRINFCMIYLHERGHNAGLSHESGYPIMNPSTTYEVVPPKCTKWSKGI